MAGRGAQGRRSATVHTTHIDSTSITGSTSIPHSISRSIQITSADCQAQAISSSRAHASLPDPGSKTISQRQESAADKSSRGIGGRRNRHQKLLSIEVQVKQTSRAATVCCVRRLQPRFVRGSFPVDGPSPICVDNASLVEHIVSFTCSAPIGQHSRSLDVDCVSA